MPGNYKLILARVCFEEALISDVTIATERGLFRMFIKYVLFSLK